MDNQTSPIYMYVQYCMRKLAYKHIFPYIFHIKPHFSKNYSEVIFYPIFIKCVLLNRVKYFKDTLTLSHTIHFQALRKIILIFF